MFLDTLEFRKERKKKFGKTVFKMWCQICGKVAYLSKKYFYKKEKKKYENVNNLWQILRTKLVLLVDFSYHIFKTVFPK